MIDKRLFRLVEKKILVHLVLTRLLSLACSIVMWFVIASQLAGYFFNGRLANPLLLISTTIGVIALKSLFVKRVENLTYQASADLRLTLREEVMQKAFRLGRNYPEQLPAATLAQLTVDGIEQLEIYYARFLVQLFYCLFASLLIFGSLAGFSLSPAVALLICMPLIPIVIMAVMKIAKRILSSYWSRYTNLGAKFHENLSGLSVLKAYQQDEMKQEEVVEDARKFRKVTMSLLSMQLNSITIMDIVSYCGAGLGIGLALRQYATGGVTLTGLFLFILLSAEFFIPMRQLGSLFHVAMNGISACSRLFSYLELPEPKFGTKSSFTEESQLGEIEAREVSFAYSKEEEVSLDGITASFVRGTFTAFVGKSGSGKSTFARLLVHELADYAGDITWNGENMEQFSEALVRERTILVDGKAYLYPLSIRENLQMVAPTVTEEEMWRVLEKVKLKEFVEGEPDGIETLLLENGSNLSGGQRQRLVLARALLTKADLFIFDEITSGVDLESEEQIIQTIRTLAQDKIVVFISHRLYNVLDADQVLVFEAGKLVHLGTPARLLKESDYFKTFFNEEQAIMAGGVINEKC